MKLNIKKSIKILFAILVILLLILIVSLKNVENESSKGDTELGIYNVEFTEKSVNSENFDEVLNLLPIPSIDMRTKIQNFAIDFLKHVHQTREYNEDEIEKYYETNEVALKDYLYNCNLDNFKELVQEISKLETDVLKYTNSIFYPETLEIQNNQYKFNMQISYNDIYNLNFIVHLDTNKNNIITFELAE